MKLKKYIASILAVLMVFSCVSISSLAVNPSEALDSENLGATNEELNEATPRATKSKAIIIIPGILGSELWNTYSLTTSWLAVGYLGDLYLNENGTAKNSLIAAKPNQEYGVQNMYKSMYDSLDAAFSSTFDIIFFGYDWRMSNVDSARALETVASQYSSVVLVAHSMGGLVASKYLANSAANRSRTAGFISIGTPYAGSAKCVNVMETGDIIRQEIFGSNVTLYRGTVKEICKNSLAAYQLLPTSNYNSKTTQYPISVNGTSYTQILPQLQNTAWGKTSSGTIKTQFSAATSFHSSLLNTSGTHVKNWSGVNSYTIAGSGVDTISRVNLTSSYVVSGLNYSNSGDGTVLVSSAGYGSPGITYSGTVSDNYEHTNLMKNSSVINRVKTFITSATGVSAANALAEDDNTNLLMEVTTNARGWLEGTDNQRINVYANNDAELLVNGVAINESGEALYTADGSRVGTVWPLGDSGRKMYALYNNDYEIIANGDVKIEYMNNGYFDKAVEYSAGDTSAIFAISNYATKDVECTAVEIPRANEISIILPSHVYTENELYELNQD